jgi:hypothetical protein
LQIEGEEELHHLERGRKSEEMDKDAAMERFAENEMLSGGEVE